MISNKKNIQCPSCNASISIDDVLTRQIESEIKNRMEEEHKVKMQELNRQSEQLKRQTDELKESKKNIDSIVLNKVAEQLKDEKIKIVNDAKVQAEKEQVALTAFLEEQLRDQEEKLTQARNNEVNWRKEKMK